MRHSIRGRIDPIWPLLTLIGILYLLFLPFYFVGYFGDDAIYILAARSLLHGQYVALNNPAHPPLTQFPPGYPAFLAPFVLLVGSHWGVLKALSVVLILTSVYTSWKFLDGWTTPRERWAICVLWGFNPITSLMSGTVMSEPLYILMSLLTFVVLRKTLEEPTNARWLWILGLIVGFTTIVRTVGLVLIPTVGITLLARRQWRASLLASLIGILPTMLLWLRNVIRSGHSTVHTAMLVAMFDHLSPGIWLDHLHRGAYLFLIVGLTALRLPHAGWGMPISYVLILVLSLVIGVGVRRLRNRASLAAAMTLGIVIYIVSYIGVYLFWMGIDVRFVTPILPFLVIVFVVGLFWVH